MQHSDRIRRLAIFVPILVAGLVALPHLFAAGRNAERQITDVRTDQLAEFALDDAGDMTPLRWDGHPWLVRTRRVVPGSGQWGQQY